MHDPAGCGEVSPKPAAKAKPATAVGYDQLSDDLKQLTDFRPFFANSQSSLRKRFGGRLVFDGNGYLFIAWGRIINALPPRIWISCRARSYG
ncbi:PQQ-dependent sugar dehydrogenase [Shigella flexneri]